MKKSEIIDALANNTGLTKADVTKVCDGYVELIKSELVKGNDFTVTGLGTFKVSERKARDGINPLTKEPLHIPAKKAVSFKAGKALKDEVNK